ncbi:hypothetical protein IF2G_10758 [Cordyceps javanica]|nr:hypothetical protein IF2G_10758 [Cordyceps javanica]
MKAALSTDNNHNADQPTGHIDARTRNTETSENMQTCQTRLNPSLDQQRTNISTVPTAAIDNIVFGVPEIRTFFDTDLPGMPEELLDALRLDTSIPVTLALRSLIIVSWRKCDC